MALPALVAAGIPVVSGILQNILSGINTRKARLYDSPINQVARLNQAGLPKAAASNLTPGGGVVATSSLGGEHVQGEIAKSVSTQVDRKKLELVEQEIRAARAAADLAEGNVKNQLNPTGKFEPTNQGTGAMQELTKEAEAIKGAQIVNKWMPIEKFQNIMKQSKEMDKIAADTKNSIAQNGIILSEGKIKGIIASFQERMSNQELTNIIRRNTGLKNANEISKIQGEILRMTKIAQVSKALMEATKAGQDVAANELNLTLQKLETESAKAYYTVRARADNSYSEGGIYQAFKPRDLVYLNMFSPKQSGPMNTSQLLQLFR